MDSKFYSQSDIENLIKCIEHKKKEYEAFDTINDIEFINIKQYFYMKELSNSLRIENIEFDEEEISMVLSNFHLSYGKRAEGVMQIVNLNSAWKYMRKNLDKKLTMEFIEQLQNMSMANILPDNECGIFRNGQVIITNSKHMPPHHTKVKELLKESINYYYCSRNDDSILLKILKFNHSFVKIHPFFDGNGRVSRLLLSMLLMQNGYVPMIINADKKDEYYDSLEYADIYYDYRRFYGFMLEQLNDTYNMYLNMVKTLN